MKRFLMSAAVAALVMGLAGRTEAGRGGGSQGGHSGNGHGGQVHTGQGGHGNSYSHSSHGHGKGYSHGHGGHAGHGHGKGYNMAFCDGSARWVADSKDILEPMWVLDFFKDDAGHRRIMMELLGWTQARYDKYCPLN